jgi:flagellar biosynthesis/type III secretory pathway chaperone
MSPAEKVKNILNHQLNCYRALLSLVERERASLLEFDVEDIESLSKEKDTLVIRLRLLEEARSDLIRKYFRSNDGHEVDEEAGLEELCHITGDVTIGDTSKQIVALAQSIKELNGFNSILIERSMIYVRSSMEFFCSFGLDREMDAKGALCSRRT